MKYNISRKTIRQCVIFSVAVRICSHSSCLFSFTDIHLKSTAYFISTHLVYVVLVKLRELSVQKFQLLTPLLNVVFVVAGSPRSAHP